MKAEVSVHGISELFLFADPRAVPYAGYVPIHYVQYEKS
jgi:hypothetical protein